MEGQQKQMILLRGSNTESYAAFRQRMVKEAERFRDNESVTQVSITITDQKPPAVSIIPFKKQKVAVISIYSPEGMAPQKLVKTAGSVGRYRVLEAVPVAYNRTWEDGSATPGVCLLTLFRQKKSISYDTFIHRWHNSHTPLSLKIHPLWNYSRNVVEEALAKDSEPWDGIVEEQVRTRSDLLNPFKFFGNPFIIIYNMLRVYTDTRSFLEYKTIEPYLATEYILKSTSPS